MIFGFLSNRDFLQSQVGAIVYLKRYSLISMGTTTPQAEAFQRFVRQLDRALERRRSIVQSLLQSIEGETSQDEALSLMGSETPHGTAVQRIPLEVQRLCGDDAAKEYDEWRRGVSCANNPLDVETPHFVRRSDRIRRLNNRRLSNAVHDHPAQANSGKTV